MTTTNHSHKAWTDEGGHVRGTSAESLATRRSARGSRGGAGWLEIAVMKL